MKAQIIVQLKWLFSIFDLSFSKYSTQVKTNQLINNLHQQNRELTDTVDRNRQIFDFLLHLSDGRLLPWFAESRAQLWQDLFVLHELDFKRNGFFVEFGATDGISLSNTYMLEKKFGWQGILAEPANCWHQDLLNNRGAAIDKKCVWSKSNDVLMFNQTDVAELSTINAYSDSDFHEASRRNGTTYPVDTISLVDLLRAHQAPKTIDYLSIDTEGSEYEILKNFDFKEFKFRTITCEHNHSSDREKIYSLLTSHGYIRKYTELSQFDDWYTLSETVANSE